MGERDVFPKFVSNGAGTKAQVYVELNSSMKKLGRIWTLGIRFILIIIS